MIAVNREWSADMFLDVMERAIADDMAERAKKFPLANVLDDTRRAAADYLARPTVEGHAQLIALTALLRACVEHDSSITVRIAE